ncbi:kanamycin nucleotidyltransferase C-terminal domain-containing protein [Paenibacillus sp. NPDC057934]|uniref:kanamycin nucleotidyltransferase C-terminal domain-containing protein n=1 Tax=Paenibacillus sp. NPDC057934 TaxID=3346282 RepID=UPI0036D7DAC2
MLNVFDVAKSLLNHIEKVYAEEIAIVAYYGSYAQGTATKRSDLDFFFIPATPKGYDASVQFIIDDISFDFWPISWERAERMASFQEDKTTIITDCKLLYTRSDEERKRFMKLRETTSALQASENAQKMIEKAEAELRDVYVHLYKLTRAKESGSLTFYRTEAHGILTKVFQSLALLNRTYYSKGFGKNKEQILSLQIKPARLETYIEMITRSGVNADILEACEALAADTLELILAQKEKHYSKPAYPDRMKGFYEEEKGVLDKIITACERNDFDTAFFSAVHVQDSIAAFLFYAETGQWPSDYTTDFTYQEQYRQLGFPDLVSFLHCHDLSAITSSY